jgi:hypothetical protein
MILFNIKITLLLTSRSLPRIGKWYDIEEDHAFSASPSIINIRDSGIQKMTTEDEKKDVCACVFLICFFPAICLI